ncbi:hypothetical protein NMY22_g8155 [Coprinellus aureogranulatus]|nr:hypothetical protein NMY22_g8155 [Coprinellus aureogranulatus]
MGSLSPYTVKLSTSRDLARFTSASSAIEIHPWLTVADTILTVKTPEDSKGSSQPERSSIPLTSFYLRLHSKVVFALQVSWDAVFAGIDQGSLGQGSRALAIPIRFTIVLGALARLPDGVLYSMSFLFVS